MGGSNAGALVSQVCVTAPNPAHEDLPLDDKEDPGDGLVQALTMGGLGCGGVGSTPKLKIPKYDTRDLYSDVTHTV